MARWRCVKDCKYRGFTVQKRKKFFKWQWWSNQYLVPYSHEKTAREMTSYLNSKRKFRNGTWI